MSIFKNEKARWACVKYAINNYCYFGFFVENLAGLLDFNEKITRVDGESVITTTGRAIRFTDII